MSERHTCSRWRCTRHSGNNTAGGGGVLPYKRLEARGCAAGWRRIFTTGLTRIGSHFK